MFPEELFKIIIRLRNLSECPPPSLKHSPLLLELMLTAVSKRIVFLSASWGECLNLVHPVAGRAGGFLPCCRRALVSQGQAPWRCMGEQVPHSLPSSSPASSRPEGRACTPAPTAKPSLAKIFRRVMAHVSWQVQRTLPLAVATAGSLGLR